ncbi:MAG: MFS transporter [Gammaproteobacteria bacterium]|nr:MFS transporter [Gammaproteobacteria bacterium]
MTASERRAAFSLAAIYAFRMLGLFMILPVMALYAETLDSPDPLLIGLAIGIYGLTQALLAIPYGLWSDRLGRKPVIAFGLLVFAIGSVVAAMADTITGVIIGRALQGAGAVAAAVMALASDLTREEHRTRTMAIIGMTIGLSFAASLGLGPILERWIGVPGIFWLTSVLALAGIAVLYLLVPDTSAGRGKRDTGAVPGYFREVLRNRQLLRLDAGVFVLHCMLTATFVAVPFALRDYAGLDSVRHGYLYLPVLLLSLLAMFPLVIVAETRRRLRETLLMMIVALAVAQLLLWSGYGSTIGIAAALLVFFVAFNVLEALLPSLLTKFAPADKKGTAMGMFSAAQFLGAFTGGVFGGWLYGRFGFAGVFGGSLILASAWFLWARGMEPVRYLSSYMIFVGESTSAEIARKTRELLELPGVAEAVIVGEEGVAYLKVDNRTVDRDQIAALAQSWQIEAAGA